MNKLELRELAEWGVRRRVESIEAQLAKYHHEYPELFLSETAPVLLRPEPRESSNGHWPPIAVTPPSEARHAQASAAAKASWTPERRRKQGLAMKRMIRKKRAAKTAQAAPAAEKATKQAASPRPAKAKKKAVAEKKAGTAPVRPQQQVDLGTYQHMHDYLTLHPGSRLTAIAESIGAKHPANASSRLKLGIARGWFSKKQGLYHAEERPSEG